MTFGMTITIFDEEMDLCKRLSRQFGSNAIWVIMQEHPITIKEAKKLCKLKIEKHVAFYVRDAREAQINLNYSAELRRYLKTLHYIISGNAA